MTTDADLRVWRAKHRLTQSQAASLLVTSQQTVSYWENGGYPRDLAERLARAERALAKPASKADRRTQARYDALKANLAEAGEGRTVADWYQDRMRLHNEGHAHNRLSAAELAHARRMFDMYCAEMGV